MGIHTSYKACYLNPFEQYNLKYSFKFVDDTSGVSLAQYIREVALLTGTKISCNEGGCGSCIITVRKEGKSRSVNSVSHIFIIRIYYLNNIIMM